MEWRVTADDMIGVGETEGGNNSLRFGNEFISGCMVTLRPQSQKINKQDGVASPPCH